VISSLSNPVLQHFTDIYIYMIVTIYSVQLKEK